MDKKMPTEVGEESYRGVYDEGKSYPSKFTGRVNLEGIE